MSTRYTVKINEYAQRHFIKSFAKKYLNKWDLTLKAIMLQLENVEEFYDTNYFEKIHVYEKYFIAKVEFSVAGSKESKKTSGCRYIIRVDVKDLLVEILLVYSKNDVDMKNETTWWQKQIEGLVSQP